MTTVERNVFANRARDARAKAITEQVQVDLLDHLRDLQREAPRYIREYVETLVGPKTIRRPSPHMHSKLAELIRELALEAAAMDRRTYGAALPAPTTRDGRVSVVSSRGKAA